jgi:hypothetical protein
LAIFSGSAAKKTTGGRVAQRLEVLEDVDVLGQEVLEVPEGRRRLGVDPGHVARGVVRADRAHAEVLQYAGRLWETRGSRLKSAGRHGIMAPHGGHHR